MNPEPNHTEPNNPAAIGGETAHQAVMAAAGVSSESLPNTPAGPDSPILYESFFPDSCDAFLRMRLLVCAGCGCVFAIAKALYFHRRETCRRVFCPGCGRSNVLHGSQDAARQFSKISVPLAAARMRPAAPCSERPASPSLGSDERHSDRPGRPSEASNALEAQIEALAAKGPFWAIREPVDGRSASPTPVPGNTRFPVAIPRRGDASGER